MARPYRTTKFEFKFGLAENSVMTKYNPQKIEKKWQKYWETKKIYNTKDSVAGKINVMHLTEFPYPSGNLHIGHWYAFALPDIRARFLRMYKTGAGDRYNVMYPIGFDAFGLPAENAAIENGIHPEKWTKQNVAYMTKQLKSMGTTFDWSREVSTIDPDYYKWTQWMFIKFYNAGLAYRAPTRVNWCPKDKTVLANEQVIDGRCDRCGSEVVQKELTQWMFKITEFRDELIDDLDKVDWQDTAKLGQRNWVGRSEGALIKFQIQNSKLQIPVFTTRPDTIFGATFIVLAPEHELVKKITKDTQLGQVNNYLEKTKKKTELERLAEVKEKTGVFTGAYAINPANGEKIPIWISDFVLPHYGTGAIMAVPAHDQRDFEFAKKFDLPIKEINLDNEILKQLSKKGLAGRKITYRLHDWILSRQRYWGAPIPMINCPDCGYQPVAEKDLPVKLPPLKDFKPSNDGRSPLAKAIKWLKVRCPKCGGQAERETDTMDTFVDSSWYFIRYTDPKNKKEFASKDKMRKWLPVYYYLGGAEHTTMHLLYSRFFTKALYRLGFLDFDEPFKNRRNRGIILGPDNQKMSKSRGNVIDPDIEVKKYGADAVRMYLAFMGPYLNGGSWNPNGITGVYRFLNRVWNFVRRYNPRVKPNPKAVGILNKYIKGMGYDIDNLSFNTGVSGLMKLLNELESHEISKKEYETLLKLLAPFAPHLAEELWQGVLKNKKSIHLENWPEYDPKLIKEETVDLVIQVNGRTRDVIKAPRDLSESEVRDLALASEKIKKHISGKEVKKFIYISNKLANVVV